jgi:hypothetical protein
VSETVVDLDADVLRAAAGRAEVLWDDGPAVAPGPDHPGVAESAVYAPEPRPTGPPPDDEAAARAAIERAFAGMHDMDGDEAVNVEGGRRLGGVLRDLHQRYGSAVAGAVQQVERVTFLDATSAAVLFSVWLGQSPYLPGARGDAVLEDGRWRVARSTFCGLVSRVGIVCPP